MNSSAMLSLASIIPGLGLWLLGKRRDAVIMAILVLSAVLVFFYSPGQALTRFSCVIGVFLWVMQIMYTQHEARLAQALKSGTLQQAKENTPVVPPSELSRDERLAFKAKETVRQQLEVDEYVFDAIPSIQASSSYQFCYIGLLADNFIFVSADFLGEPAGIARIGFSSIRDLTVEYGLLTDTLIMFIDGKGPTSFEVTRWLRSHTDKFVSMFKEKKNLQT